MTESRDTFPKLLTQDEVAAFLRCRPAKVKRLRLSGRLGYYSGRPVVIAEEDVNVYLASRKVRRVRSSSKSGSFEYIPVDVSNVDKLMTKAEAAAKFETTVARIRSLYLRGRVPYIRSNPVLIDEADLIEYFEAERLARNRVTPGTPEYAIAENEKAEQKMFHRLRVLAVRRKVAQEHGD
jgi:hypothetical protein